MKIQKKKGEYEENEMSYGAKDFWNIIQKQKGKCAITGRELTPLNTQIELRDPYKEKDRLSLTNIYAVEKSVSYLARHYSELDIVNLAVEIIRHRGLEYGFGVEKVKKRKL
ncbi:hypothetical protein [Leptospira santarosai]|uniref:hypothetical protein n=1 Tax=Leptospira santarosai TaxID=28183 RepID=UPI0007733286|nr:hypothetical protein [Leptospira santarosai]